MVFMLSLKFFDNFFFELKSFIKQVFIKVYEKNCLLTYNLKFNIKVFTKPYIIVFEKL